MIYLEHNNQQEAKSLLLIKPVDIPSKIFFLEIC